MKHYFEVEVAAAVGVNAAVVFENIAFWILHNEKQGKNERDGAYWMYATQKDLAEQFDYLTEKQVRTAIEKLKAADYLRVGNYNRHGYDRTVWYKLGEKGESIKRKGLMLVPELANGESEKAEGSDNGGGAIPIYKQDIKNKDSIKKRAMEIALRCGIKTDAPMCAEI